ncbi:MAG: helix-turn-helix domain-containing protein [Pyrinomonadaceae bacterium]|nr:helix-turn-helix domain-containing protein [Pyrinomonadaceae bacterium]
MAKQNLLTTKQAAEILGVHQSRIYALIDSQRLPATRFGKSWIIEESDLQLVAERKTGRPKKADNTDEK